MQPHVKSLRASYTGDKTPCGMTGVTLHTRLYPQKECVPLEADPARSVPEHIVQSSTRCVLYLGPTGVPRS